MELVSAEDAKGYAEAYKTGSEATVSFLKGVVAIFGPWPTAGLIIAVLVVLWLLARMYTKMKAEEEAGARRGYELTVEKMSSEIRWLRTQVLENKGYPFEEVQRRLDLTEGFRQSALAGDAPAAPGVAASASAGGAGAEAAEPEPPTTKKARKGKG